MGRSIYVVVLFLGLVSVSTAPSWAADPGFIGLEVQGLDARAASVLGPGASKGVLVKDAALGEPGAMAGFRRGDLIVAFAGRTVASFEDLLNLVAETAANQVVPVVVLRGGKTVELTLRTTAKPAAWRIAAAKFQNYPDVGFTVAAIDDDVRKKLSLPWGTVGLAVTIVDEKAAAARALRAGEVIVSANLHDVWEPRQLTRQIEDAREAGRSGILLLVSSSGGYRYTILPIN